MKANARSILTEYSGYIGGGKQKRVLRVTRSSNPNNAVKNCVGRMQVNQYDAVCAEVYDTVTGELHAQVKRSVDGNIQILFKRDPCNFVTKETLEQMKARKLLRAA